MEWVETTGRSLEEAKELALDRLGVDEADAEFEVIEEPRAGLFGRVRGEARVRARVRPTAPRAKEDRRDRRRRGRSGDEPARPASSSTAPSGGANGAATEVTTPAGSSAEEPGSGGSREPSGSGEPSTTGAAGSGSRRRRRGGRGGRQGAKPAQQEVRSAGAAASDADGAELPTSRQAGEAVAGEAVATQRGGSERRRPPSQQGADAGRTSTRNDKEREGEDVEVPLEEQGRVAQDFLSALTAEFGMQANFKISQSEDENLNVDVSGSGLGLLIGPKGSTLLAIQDLTRTVVHHRTGASNGRIHVDVGGYRSKRSEALARFALQVADKVKETGARTALEPMAAPDRKVVHDALTEVDGVSTVSEGEEPRRRVVIVPAES